MINDRQGMLRQAITAARAGQQKEAYQLLQGLVALEPSNAEAWLWLAGVAGNPAERRVALERVLLLDPRNARARQGLDWLRQRYPPLFASDPHGIPSDPDAAPIGIAAAQTPVQQPAVAPDLAPYLVTPDMLGPAPSYADARESPVSVDTLYPAVEPAPISVAAPVEADYVLPPAEYAADPSMAAYPSNGQATPTTLSPYADTEARPPDGDEEYRCPFCGAWARSSDARCPRCQESLIVAVERRFGPRLARVLQSLLWLLLSGGAIAASIWLLGEAQLAQAQGGSVGGFLQVYGLPVDPGATFQILNWTGLALGAVALLGVVMALGLLRRRRLFYILEFLLALTIVAGAVALLFLAYPLFNTSSAATYIAGMWGLVVGGGAVLFALLVLLLALWSRHEFYPHRMRVRLPIQLLSGADHFRLGARYRDRGWRWAAAEEIERAVEQEPDALKYRKVLAEVYSSMGNHARARDELRASLNLHPDTSPSARAGSLLKESRRGRQ